MSTKINYRVLHSRIPKSVMVGKTRYKIVIDPNLVANRQCYGLTEFEERRITLASTTDCGNLVIPSETMIITLFHEYLHAASHECSWRLSEDSVLRGESLFEGLFTLFQTLIKEPKVKAEKKPKAKKEKL